MEGDKMSDTSQITTLFASPNSHKDLLIHHMNDPPCQSGAVIVKSVDPQVGFPSSSKFKSLLPKSLIERLNKSNISSLSNTKPEIQSTLMSNTGILNTNFQTPQQMSSYYASQVVTDITSHIENNDKNSIGLQNNDSFLRIMVKEPSFAERKDESTGIQKDEFVESSPLAISGIESFVDIEKEAITASSPNHVTIKKEEDSNVKKKTTIESFVKMIVCRKVTVQTVDEKTGEILDTTVKTEEDEPVILGVDCLERTEKDLSTKSETKGDNQNRLSTSKLNATLDGGLKFLSAVSESRSKIAKSVQKDKLAPSILQVSRPEIKDSSDLSKSDDGYQVSFLKPNDLEIRDENEFDWDEDFNDDSEDFVPDSFLASQKSNNSAVIKSTPPSSSLHKKSATSSSITILPKKRGRKRKWDNAIGLSLNLKRCQFCSKNFNDTQTCAKHMKKGKCVKSIYCFICSKDFDDEAQLEKHLLLHKNESKSSYKCQNCHRTYSTKAGYVKHFRSGTCEKKDDINYEDGSTGDFKCGLCESRFSTESYLKLHKYKVHENPKDRHDCTDCGKKFYSYNGYQKHKASKCTEPLKCHICQKSYSRKARESFKVHMQRHKCEVSGLTYNCEECGRGYMTRTALNKHKLSHTGVKPYKCETCGKEFSMRYMVKDHARMHTGERPYTCGLCGNSFSNRGHLGRHMRSHENGTLLKRGRPKKIREPEEGLSQESTGLKMIFHEALQGYDGQSIQVVDGQVFDTQGNTTPMIIQADNNTIIIAEGWPEAHGTNPGVNLEAAHEIVNVTNISPNLAV